MRSQSKTVFRLATILMPVLLSCCGGERPPLGSSLPVERDQDARTESPGGGAAAGAPVPAPVSAGTGAPDEAPPPAEPIEARGMWVTRWDYHSPDDVRAILDDALKAGLNQVYFQVRGEADAYYRSTLEPWAQPLTGTLGKDPGWDPLAVAVEEAHTRGLELHAWVNVAAAWKGALPPPRSEPTHVLRAHPEWQVVDNHGLRLRYADGYAFLNLGHPEVREHLQAVFAELVSAYAVDGFHLDYCRYPAGNTSFDRTSNARYREARLAEPGLTRDQWQRQELASFVGALRDRLKQLRPELIVSSTVTGIYEDRWNWGSVQLGLNDFHQDSHLWAEQQVVDVLVPMIYWPPTDPPGGRADFATLVRDFAPLKEKVRLLAGINVEAGNLSVLKQEIEITRSAGFDGVVLFAWAALKKRDWFPLLLGVSALPAGIPLESASQQ